MPIGILALVVLVIMGYRKGIDFPIAACAAVLGDQSNGSAIEGLVDALGEFLNVIWGIVASAWGSGAGQEGLVHLTYVAQVTGVVG